MTKPKLESRIVKDIVKALEAEGVRWILKTHGGSYQRSGIPDLVCIAPHTGRFVAIEVKRPELGKLTALQASQIAKINQAGGLAAVACSVEEALALLRMADGKAVGA